MAPQLPTIAEIRASSEVLSTPGASATVVKVGEKFAVKFGSTVMLEEAEALRLLSANGKVPVPKVYGTIVEPETERNYIVMEYINSKTLESLLPSLEASEKLEIAGQLRTILQDLRSIKPPPSYLGSFNGQPFCDGIFWTPDVNPAKSGPFKTEDDLNEGIIKRIAETAAPEYVTFMGKIINAILRNHQVKFTHGDLQPKNILVKRIESGGATKVEIKLIDWEMSGWYPEYWEFCSATVACRFKTEWLGMVQHILQVYMPEYLLLEKIRSILIY